MCALASSLITHTAAVMHVCSCQHTEGLPAPAACPLLLSILFSLYLDITSTPTAGFSAASPALVAQSEEGAWPAGLHAAGAADDADVAAAAAGCCHGRPSLPSDAPSAPAAPGLTF